ncbi:anaerobic ribonucleoside-triphosphate reductase activating protein [Paracoccus xiamenensis]|uniref:anaerobic ribonucleoside-triphosphate reductase activating protein n=1 Tax=Paracoccus xiamenensis TaxID=2714901 RepID=UPI00140A26F1|nr:anaerobic ribonucleoside-triphosphate reductase activating protein [Paracoccus xiamenensis]NHF74401.1 anaerobic ribonucleoside-triphosphate reductase activating protein [Paracoccus xiamenensis]
MTDIRIGGLERLSTCDWPGELVATVFLQGCPWDCPYCHNPHLIPVKADTALDWHEVLGFLRSRRGLLDGVVFSGGEPTLQRGLPKAMKAVRDLGFRVGLHSGGPYPARFASALPYCDWVGFDIKAPFAQYAHVTAAKGSGDKARESLKMLLASGVAYQVRTTVDPALLDHAAVARIGAELTALGVTRHTLQECRQAGTRLTGRSASLPNNTITAKIASAVSRPVLKGHFHEG